MSSSIDILLATYNGADFLENQILSVIGQTHKDWRLIIHDDGSTDDTLAIVQKYVLFDTRISLLDDRTHFGNAGSNFMHLLKHSNAEFIAFCDQDDVWLEFKLSMLIDAIKKEVVPTLVYGEAFTYKNARIVGHKIHFFDRDMLESSLFLNSGIQGCSVMFNRLLLKSFELPDYVFMHDHIITLAAVTFGKIIKVNLPLLLYRQHQSNVTGNMKIGFFDRLSLFFVNAMPVLNRAHYEATLSFFNKNRLSLNARSIQLFDAYQRFPSVSRSNRLLIILKYQFRIGNLPLILLLKTLFRKPI